MSNLISTFQERFGDWVAALGQHLQLSLLTLLLAIFLAVPLAIYLSTRKRVSNWVLQLAGVFQTISSKPCFKWTDPDCFFHLTCDNYLMHSV